MTRLAVLLACTLAACGGASSQPATPAGPPLSNTESTSSSNAAGDAIVIEHTAKHGVLELRGDRNAAMHRGDELMTQHCGANAYVIVQEGEEALGAGTYHREGAADTGERTATAWRVHYQCN